MPESPEPDVAGTGGDPEVAEAKQPEDRKAALYRRRMRAYRLLLPILVLVAFLSWGFTTNYIPSPSMLPTLKPGDHIITMKSWLAYPGGRAPARGDIVVFALPSELPKLEISDAEELRHVVGDLQERIHIPPGSLKHIKADILIKRVVGLPGETVQIKGKDIFINGSKLAGSHFGAQGEPDPLQEYAFAQISPLKLKDDEVFVLGDNIENSEDGRYWGPLKRRNILGKFVRVLWNDGGKLSEAKADAAAAGSP